MILYQHLDGGYAQMHRDALLHLWGQLSDVGEWEKTSITDTVEAMIGQGMVWIAHDDHHNRPVGTITCLIQHTIFRGGKPAGHLENIVVDNAYRGQGIASDLIRLALSYARDQQCYKIILNCSDKLVGYYQRFGFVAKDHGMKLYVGE